MNTASLQSWFSEAWKWLNLLSDSKLKDVQVKQIKLLNKSIIKVHKRSENNEKYSNKTCSNVLFNCYRKYHVKSCKKFPCSPGKWVQSVCSHTSFVWLFVVNILLLFAHWLEFEDIKLNTNLRLFIHIFKGKVTNICHFHTRKCEY